jgi:O-antigen ligase
VTTPAAAPRASVWEWTLTALLAANLGWTTLCLGGFRPETMLVTGVMTAALVIVHFTGRAIAPASRHRLHPAGWWLLPFLIYAAANVSWVTPVRWLGWMDWFSWAQLVAVFWVVLNDIRSPAPRRTLMSVLLTLAIVAVALGCYQRFVRPDWLMLGRVQAEQYQGRASGPFGIPNSFAAFLLLLIPAVGAMAARRSATAIQRVFFGWGFIVLVFGLGLTISRGAWIGLALGLVLWPLVNGRWLWRRRLSMAAGALVGVVIVIAATYLVAPQVRARFAALVHEAGERSRPILWRAGWKLFRAEPVTGTGAGSFNVLFERYRPEGFLDEPRWAHNDYLNTLSDYGAVGFALFFGAAALVAGQCARARRPKATAAITSTQVAWDEPFVVQALAIGLLAFALQLFVDFHFKIPALAIAFATLAALVVRARWPDEGFPLVPASAKSVAHLSAAIAIAVLAATYLVPAYSGEALRYRSRQAIDALADDSLPPAVFRKRLERAWADLVGATERAPGNAYAWSDLSYALAQRSRMEPKRVGELGQVAEAAANHAIGLAPVCAEFWIRRGVARDLQGRWIDAGADFTRAIELSPRSALSWYHHAYHLSLKPTERALALAMVDFCLRLDPVNADGLRLRQRLAFGHKVP